MLLQVITQKVSVNIALFGLILILSQVKTAESQIFHGSKTKNISCQEKWWAVGHLCIARKAFNLTRYSLEVTDSIGQTNLIGTNIHGGNLDAFKHAFWMATLAQHINWKKARRLGLAHEKANYRSFDKASKKGMTDGHDQPSTDMDLWNNEKGLAIGMVCCGCDREALVRAVVDSIMQGSMKIIRMNEQGEFLDKDGIIIPPGNLTGKWVNDKCLTPSGEKNQDLWKQ